MAEIRISDPDTPGARLTVERSVDTRRLAFVHVHHDGGGAHLDIAETRRLRDELNKLLGESDTPWVPQVGARVVVVRDTRGRTTTRDGKAGELVRIDAYDADLSYKVRLDEDGEGWWVHSIRPERAEVDPELADHLRVSAAQDAADAAEFARRSAAAEKARELLTGRVEPGSYGASPQALMQFADWLLGETN